ncbi:hypothetical protein D1872_313660 [compost metagenome]
MHVPSPLTNLLEQLQSVHPGHADINHKQVRNHFFKSSKCFFSASRGIRHLIAQLLPRNQGLQAKTQFWLIVNDHH